MEDNREFNLRFKVEKISLSHIKRLTTRIGILQFSNINIPDMDSGYSLSDNALALIAATRSYELKKDPSVKLLIDTYLQFINHCQRTDGSFFEFIDKNGRYGKVSVDKNQEDSESKVIWALGEYISRGKLFNGYFVNLAELVLINCLLNIEGFSSPKAIAFTIKGLYSYNLAKKSLEIKKLICVLADKLIGKYRMVQDANWFWYEDYLSHDDSVLPEALLYAYLSSGKESYKITAKSSFYFLISAIFSDENSQFKWSNMYRNYGLKKEYGQQPHSVTDVINALDLFYATFRNEMYKAKLEIAFSWFNGNNNLNQIVYDSATGGCCDGLEAHKVSPNQGAESTVCYLLARCVFDNYINSKQVEDFSFNAFNLQNQYLTPKYIIKNINSTRSPYYPLFN